MRSNQLEAYERAIATELGKLQLEKLDPDWTKEVIDNDFLQCQDLPVAYEEVLDECNLEARLQDAYKATCKWIEVNQHLQNETNRESIASNRVSLGPGEEASSTSLSVHTVESSNRGSQLWRFLFQEEKFSVDSLLAVLGFLIDRGCSLSCDFIRDRQRCFHAVNLYFALVSVPGSMAFRVFHQMLFAKATQIINLYVQAIKHCAKPLSASQKKNSKQASQEVEEEQESIITEEDFSLIEKSMPVYLKSLLLVSEHLSFKRYPNILRETVEGILPLISIGHSQCSLKALEVVQHFCSPVHGDTAQAVHHVFIHLLPYLIMDPNQRDLSNRDLVALKDTSFNLVQSFVSKFGETVYPLVKGLIKYVCFEVVDKADFRQKTAQTALDILDLIPEDQRNDVLKWFLLLGFADQASLRMFSLEIFALLLHHGRLNALGVAVIFCQCSDPSATVKAKALSLLGDCIESNEPNVQEMLNIIFSQNSSESDRTTPAQDEPDSVESRIIETLQSSEETEVTPDLLPKASDILSLLKERAADDKVYVRKNSLQLLLTIAQRHERYLNQEILKLLGSSCRDAAMLIRRHMAQMLTDLVLQYPERKEVQHIWAQYVLPLVLDGETRVQEKALESLDQLVLHSLVGADSQLAWNLLDVITAMGFSVYVSKAVEMATRKQQLPNKLMRTLQSNVETRPQAALTLMAIVSTFAPVENPIKVFSMDYLGSHLGSNDPSTIYCLQQIYKILGAAVPSMENEQRNKIRSLSSRLVSNFNMPLELISPACDMIVYCIQQQHEDEDDARKVASSWGSDILVSCGEYLSIHLRKPEPVSIDEEEDLARRIITLGCVGIHCPREVNKRHFLLLQHAAFQPESGVDAPIPSSQSQSQPSRRLPPKLQAGAVISLGKLSYQHEEMAKQLIPGLGRLLETTPHRAVRNNIVCVLCDWIVRYATAIDPVMPQVTACLRDPFHEVKKQALILLIHLLQEDYLKIRGTFFFRILQLACDDDEGLKDLALFYITQRLLHRQPTIIQQHFIESIFHYNDYRGHPTYNKYNLTEREKKLFSIAGANNTQRRHEIYMFMLQHMDDEARFQLTYRLTRDVLNGVVEDVMSLKNASTEAVLKDALAVLSSDNIKLASLTTPTEEDPVDKEDIAQAIVQSTKKAIIAQVVKRNVIENVVPIVVALKRKLAACKSSLMGNLMQFLRELMKDYKDEIQEILAEDKQLMAEIDFDLKRFEQQERMETARQSMANRTERVAPPPELANLASDNAAPAASAENARKEVQSDEPIASQEPELRMQEDNDPPQQSEEPSQEAEQQQHTEEATDEGAEGIEPPVASAEPEAGAVAEPLIKVEGSRAEAPRKKRKSKDRASPKLPATDQEVEAPTTRPARRYSRAQRTRTEANQEALRKEPSIAVNDDVENVVAVPPVPREEGSSGAEHSQEDDSRSQRTAKRSSRARPATQKKVQEKSFAKPTRPARERLLQPRIMSTPIRNIPVDEVSFNIRDADISQIPHAESRAKRRRV